MFEFTKIEKTTRNIAFIHFCVMFGYKMFSLFFPLFLVEKHFSLPQVGYSAFVLYFSMVLLAPLVGFLNHKINSGVLAALGILGYGLYCLGMMFFPNFLIFYLLQILLGLSAALFFVSARTILMGSYLENPNRAFAWFYVAPSYADAIAPLVGALIIWKFGFYGVFAVGFCVQFLVSLFCFFTLSNSIGFETKKTSPKVSLQNYGRVLDNIRKKKITPFILLAFVILVCNGLINTFFVLFLKNLGWSRETILLFNALLSLAFLPVSMAVVSVIGKLKSRRNVYFGSVITALFYVILGGLSMFLNFYSLFLLMTVQSIGGLMVGSGRSALMTTKLKEYPQESAAVDSIFSPFSTAVGGLIGGLVIVLFGYPLIFIFSGAVILGAGALMGKKVFEEKM